MYGQPGTFKCARSRCKTCALIHDVEKMSGPKRSIKITHHFTCTSANVICCLTYLYWKKLKTQHYQHTWKTLLNIAALCYGTLFATINKKLYALVSIIWKTPTNQTTLKNSNLTYFPLQLLALYILIFFYVEVIICITFYFQIQVKFT